MADRPGSAILGTNVRALRRGRGLTQDQLAEKAGITKSYVCRVEKGNRPVNDELLDKLATALDVDVAALDESMPLETRSTVWRLECQLAETAAWSHWGKYDGDTRAMIETLRAAYSEREWRAVRVETIETVEVW